MSVIQIKFVKKNILFDSIYEKILFFMTKILFLSLDQIDPSHEYSVS